MHSVNYRFFWSEIDLVNPGHFGYSGAWIFGRRNLFLATRNTSVMSITIYVMDIMEWSRRAAGVSSRDWQEADRWRKFHEAYGPQSHAPLWYQLQDNRAKPIGKGWHAGFQFHWIGIPRWWAVVVACRQDVTICWTNPLLRIFCPYSPIFSLWSTSHVFFFFFYWNIFSRKSDLTGSDSNVLIGSKDCIFLRFLFLNEYFLLKQQQHCGG